MLQTLRIENVALIDKATLDFSNGLNVISGETGAGKSILLDSLSFVFGGRADKSLIRSGARFMKVEAIFSNLNEKHIEYLRKELSIDCDDELFLSREVDLGGKNICKINGELVPVAVVKRVCQALVDVHGQSEHLAILNNDYQLKIIDMYSKESPVFLLELEKEICEYRAIEKEINALGGNEKDKQNLIDLYTYQINEIEKADIKENEYEELVAEKREMQQYEKINESLKTVNVEIGESGFERSVIEKLSNSIKAMNSIQDMNSHYKEILDRLISARLEIEDLYETVTEDIGNNIYNEERFNYVDNRIDYLKTIFRKYGNGYEEINNYYLDIKQKLDNLINGQEKYEKYLKIQEKILENIQIIQEKLTFARKNSAKDLINKMQKELNILGMPDAKMDIEFNKIDEKFSLTGIDRVEYMFSSNLGFELKPLNKVVSGGEMSRVMLAYKIVVSEVDDIQTIIFDEVDSGLSGNIALVVAEYMARLAKLKQIIAVSHLPQICAMADYNIKVEKYSDEVTTHTKAIILDEEESLKEVARLMGAGSESMGVSASRELKTKLNNYKNSL